MSERAPEIKVTLTAEDRGVSAAIKELGNQLTLLKQKQNEVADSSINLKNAFEAVIASAVVLKVIEFGKEVFNTTVAIGHMSEKTGLSAKTLSVFGKAAEESGASTEEVNIGLGRLAVNITKFQQGGTQAAAAFQALNIKASDFSKLSSDEKMRLVIDRLGGLKTNFEKTAVATALFGKGGKDLIPVLDKLAGEGFEKMTEAARKSGQLLDNEMTADARNAAAAFAELEGAAKGIAVQFEAGLIPALTDVANAMTNSVGDGVTAWRELGYQTGVVLKGIVLGVELFADIVAAIMITLYEAIKTPIVQIGDAFEGTFKAAELSAHGHFVAAGQAMVDAYKRADAQAQSSADNAIFAWAEVARKLTRNAHELFPDDIAKLLKPKPPGTGTDPEDDKANKAKLARRIAELQNELAEFKAKNTAEESLNQIAYNEGLESIRQFYAKKKALAQAESAERIGILKKELTLTEAAPVENTKAAEEARTQKIAKLKSEIRIADVTAAQTQAQLDSQLLLQEEAHQKTLLGYRAQNLRAQGLAYEAAILQIHGEEAAIRIALKQAGLSGADLEAMVSQIQTLKLATAKFDEEKKQGEEGLRGLALERDNINLRVTAGLETQYQATLDIAHLELSRIPALQAIAAAMRKDAISPDEINAADEFAQKIKGIQVNATAAANQMQQFGKQSKTAIMGDLNTFLTSTIITARSVGDAFRQLAASVVGSIQKIVTALLLEIVQHKILKALGKDDSGAAGVGAAAAKGTAQAAPLLAAAASMTASGAVITAGATALGVSAAALQVAADTLIIANSAGGGIGHAGGGLITGPGTSTSDSIPARLSAGEFVVRAAAVRALGLPALATINRGVTIPAIAGMAVSRFAEGGLVQGAGGDGAGELHLGIGLDEGLILRHLSSKTAGRIVLQHLANNPKAAGKALSRG